MDFRREPDAAGQAGGLSAKERLRVLVLSLSRSAKTNRAGHPSYPGSRRVGLSS
jgi:hypothetical protein